METFLISFVFPCIVAFATSCVFWFIDKRKNRKKYNKLGSELLSLIIDEIETGSNIIKDYFNETRTKLPKPLPHINWNGIDTISEDMLLRIFAISKEKSSLKYPIKDIRKHCNHYFENDVKEWNNSLKNVYISDTPNDYYKKNHNYYDEAIMLLDMLKYVKTNLNK